MALTKKPVTGMRDILPREMQIRNYVIERIRDTYGKFGFTSIETPVVENLDNLTSRQGGDNEKLIFRILKRGEKLNLKEAVCAEDLADSGLRYDLTVPLARYYAAHAQELPSPFRALQIGPVFRADRPQRGRFRQFYQCDIDILGEPGNLAETELILAATTLLGKLGFADFTIHLNDRRILKAMTAWSGFPTEAFDAVCIILDKMDKIGRDGVERELRESGFPAETVDRYMALFAELEEREDGLTYLSRKLEGVLEPGTAENLQQIIGDVSAAAETDFHLRFDPALVRGMSYYTGTIFEIELAGMGSACGGGGRYDGMIEKFTNRKTPACGFSIGFERLITILLEQGFTVPDEPSRTAFLIEKKMPADRLGPILQEAQRLRADGTPVLVSAMNKNRKHQRDVLRTEGYTQFREFYVNPLQ